MSLLYKFSNQKNESPYKNVIYQRNYEEESQRNVQPFTTSIIENPSSSYGLGYLGLRAATAKFKGTDITKYFVMDEVYNFTRRMEQRLPLFRVALKASQLGDLMSPFVSDKTLRYKFSGNEILDSNLNWRKSFEGIQELVQKNTNKITFNGKPVGNIESLIKQYGIEFNKTGNVFGNLQINTGEGMINLAENIFVMERARLKHESGLSSFFEAGRRTIVPFGSLKDSGFFMKIIDRFGGKNLSTSQRESVRKYGGFAKNYLGDYFGEFFRAMNTFLKEPVPGFDSIFATKTTGPMISPDSSDPLFKMFNDLVGTSKLNIDQKIPFGRLPQALRPYVSSEKWQSTVPRLIAALSAKGAFYTMGLPGIYFAADSLRRKFEGVETKPVSAALFAGLGLGVGSVLHSSVATQLGKYPITKTQLAGAAIGGTIGLLPTFDKGIGAGFANLYGRANIAGAKLWDAVGGQESLRRQEDLFPGLTNPITGVGFLISGGVLGYINREIGTTRSLLGTKFGYQAEKYDQAGKLVADARQKASALFKLQGEGLDVPDTVLSDAREAVIAALRQYENINQIGRVQSIQEAAKILGGKSISDTPKSPAGYLATLLKDKIEQTPELQRAYSERVLTDSGRQELAGRLAMHSDEIANYLFDLETKNLGMLDQLKSKATRRTPGFVRGAIRGGAAFGAVSMLGAIAAGPMGGNFSPVDLIPGWLINLTGGGYSGKEAEDVYTGKKEVAIRKARWWAMGKTPFQGTKVSYFRKHRSVLMQSDAKVNALYGSREEMEAYSPILNPVGMLLDPEFLYHRENRMAGISPTPLTGRLFTDVPIIGEVLASTLGEVIKPTRAIRPNEWMTNQTSSLGAIFSNQPVQAPPGFTQFQNMGQAPPVKELGGKTNYDVQFQNSMAYTAKWTFERMSEQSGLRGFMLNTFLENFGYQSRSYAPIVERGDRLFSAKESFWSMNLGDPFGLCFTGNTLVNTIRGRKPIRDVEIGEQVLSLDGIYRQVTDKLIIKEHDKQLLKLKISTINTELTCTDNHWVPVFKRDRYSNGHCKPLEKIELVDTQAKDIEPGDYVVVPIIQENKYQIKCHEESQYTQFIRLDKQTTDTSTENWIYWPQVSKEYALAYEDLEEDPEFWNREKLRSRWNDKIAKAVLRRYKLGNIKRYPVKLLITANFLYWLGWYTAKGHTEQYKINFTLAGTKTQEVNELQDIGEELYLGRGESHNNNSSIELRFSNKYLASFLNKYFGKGAHNKKIPEWIKLLPKELLVHYLSGLIKEDGWYKGFTSESRDLVLDLSECLLRLGIKGNMQLNYLEKPNGNYPQNTPRKECLRHYYRVASSHEVNLIEVINRIVPMPINKIGGSSFIYENKLFVKVRSIEKLNHVEPVYDLTIEDLHYYTVEQIAVHNTEATRRYLTKDRNAYYNPLTNMAPSWLPSKDYFRDFKHGNYFAKIDEGYLRLPGEGYETLHPELKGLHPEQYSLAYKYKILSDVAYSSNEWKFTKEQVIQNLQAGRMSEEDKVIVSETNRQLQERSLKRVYRKYQFDEDKLKKVQLKLSAVYDDGTFSTVEYGKRIMTLGGINYSQAAMTRKVLENENMSTIADAQRVASEKRANVISKIRGTLKAGDTIEAFVSGSQTDQYSTSMTEVYIPTLSNELVDMGVETKQGAMQAQIKYNSAQKMFGRAWEMFTHNTDLPITPALAINSILPFQPQSKFIKRLTPTELYAETQVYGRDIQMWQRYKEDFIDSAFNSATAKLIGDFIPNKVAYRRSLMEYFDKLTWYKNFVLEQASKKSGNAQAVEFYASKRKQTIFGADPYKGFSDIWRALPSSDRDFYKDFVKETDEGERKKILALVPEYMKNIYLAQWQNKDIQALRNKIDAGNATDQEKKDLYSLYNLRRVEGMNWNRALQQEFDTDRSIEKGTSYADWMRMKQMKEYFKEFKMPRGNWVGFCVPGDQEIITTRGFKKASRINVGDSILMNGEEQIVLKKYQRKINEDIYSISTTLNTVSKVRCTKNHKVFVYDKLDGVIKEVAAKNIDSRNHMAALYMPTFKNDFIDIDLTTLNIKNLKEDSDGIYVWSKKFGIHRKNIRINEDVAWLIGYYLAEGHTLYRKGVPRSIEFTQNINKNNILAKLTNILEQLGYSYHIRTRTRDTVQCRSVRVESPILAAFINHVVSGKSKTKKIDRLDYFKSFNSQKYLVAGVLAGDAIKEITRTRLVTSSSIMARQFFNIMLGLKIDVSLTQSHDSYRVSFGHKCTNSLQLAKLSHVDKNHIPTLQNRINKRIKVVDDSFVCLPIESVKKELFVDFVYDFSISINQKYNTEFITLHNSPLVDLKDIQLQVAKQEGIDIHDIGLWDSREATIDSKPYVIEAGQELGDWSDGKTVGDFERELRKTITGLSPLISVTPMQGGNNQLQIFSTQNRAQEIKRIYSGYGVI